MRAKEFTINVPINIKINGDGDPEIEMPGNEPEADEKDDVFIPPQQQELELKKAQQGKKSVALAQITDEPEQDEIA